MAYANITVHKKYTYTKIQIKKVVAHTFLYP